MHQFCETDGAHSDAYPPSSTELCGPRLRVSCDGVVSSSDSLAAHAVRDLPAVEDPAVHVQRSAIASGGRHAGPHGILGKIPLAAPARVPLRVARQGRSAQAGGLAVLRLAAGASGLGASFQRCRPPVRRRRGHRRKPNHLPMPVFPDGGEPESGARAERRLWRRGCGALFAAPFGLQEPPAPSAFSTPPRCPAPTRVFRNRLFGGQPRRLCLQGPRTSFKLFAFLQTPSASHTGARECRNNRGHYVILAVAPRGSFQREDGKSRTA